MTDERAYPAGRRRCGILLHLTSLPGPGPVGTMGEYACRFVDFLQHAGQQIWQVLPLGPPARGNSPYSSVSVFAGNPFLIDLPDLERRGLLPPGGSAALRPSPGCADYGACERQIPPLLRAAFEFAPAAELRRADELREKHGWLEDYALFRALQDHTGRPDHRLWPKPLRRRKKAALEKARRELREEIRYHIYIQYLFSLQWSALKQYSNERGISIFGDLPIYADENSVEVWAHPELFELDENGAPTHVAGVPPDDFSETGQLWGNPLYNWQTMERTGYDWWIRRLREASRLYDIIRIDHFRALDAYYAIPVGERDAKRGEWWPGPGLPFLKAVERALPGRELVAEDLGLLTESVRELREQAGIPGLKVLQFAFDPEESSSYLPHAMERHCVAYIGTHDNDTAIGWLRSAPPEHARFARQYMRLSRREGEHWGVIRTLYACPADTVVVQMQDFLGLDSRARMNVPAIPDGNWRWRLEQSALTGRLAGRIYRMARLYGRPGKAPAAKDDRPVLSAPPRSR